MKSTSIGILLLMLLLLGCNACSDAHTDEQRPTKCRWKAMVRFGKFVPLGRTGLVTDRDRHGTRIRLWDVRLRMQAMTALLLSMNRDDDGIRLLLGRRG
jgi:hypothetical protein